MVKNILAGLLIGGALFVLRVAGPTPDQRERIHKLENSLLAPCCYSEVVSRHNSEVAVKMQLEIAAWVTEGKSDREILDDYKNRYGLRVLREPEGPPGGGPISCRGLCSRWAHSWRCESSENGAARTSQLRRWHPNRQSRFRISMTSGEGGLTASKNNVIVNRRMAINQTAKPDPGCCPPVEPFAPINLLALEGPEADDELAKLAKAIGHPARVRILRMLSRKEARVCSEIVGELPLAQSTVSEHLRILKDARLVCSTQDGSRIGYCIDYETLRKLKALVAII